MIITGRRNFTHNGKKYRVENLRKEDAEPGKKYMITAWEDDQWKVMYAAGWYLRQFATIKEAQCYVVEYSYVLKSQS